MQERPPVIAIMGHIDHGKSTLLDYIRKTNIVAKEAGGITQHVSAYEIEHKDAHGAMKKITFLDTPGHAAFETMRTRAAHIADIAVLVVSAEEGVKAQTLEALKSIEEAKIPYIIAINKIDRPNANPDRTKQSLTEHSILIEEYGGKIPCVALSAKTGEGVDDLLTMMLLVAELEEFTGDKNQSAEGYILEANLDPKIGVTVTLVIKNGTLHTGDFVLIEGVYAKIKKLEDFLGRQIKETSFSAPVRVIGFTEVPNVGATFTATGSKKDAEKTIEAWNEAKAVVKKPEAIALGEGQVEIPVIIKTDVIGTLEAVESELKKLITDQVTLKFINAGIGPITEGDVKLAQAAENSIMIGFHVKIDKPATDLALRLNIPIQSFDIIYKLSEWMEEEIERRRPRQMTEVSIGKAKILKTFSKTKDKQVLGGQVTEGSIMKNREVKIIRRENEIGRGRIVELQEQKVKVGTVEAGTQFGGLIESKVEIASGDMVEVFDLVSK